MIYTLFKHLNKDFKIIDILPQKPTARCPFSALVEVEGEKKYVVIASTDIQKFYLKRSIEKQKEFKTYKKVDKTIVKKPITYVHMEDNDFDVVSNEVVEEENNNSEE